MDKASQKAVNEQVENQKAAIVNCVKVFSTKAGQRHLKDLRLSYCNDVWDDDPQILACNVGKRQVVKDIEAMLRLGKDPEKFASLFTQPEDDDFDIFQD